MKNIYLLGLSFLILSSCKNSENEQPKVSYEKTSKTAVKTIADTNKINISDLPIHFNGTQVLIFPIGSVATAKKSSYSGSDSNAGYTVSNYGEYEITGYLSNLKFKTIGQDSLRTLTLKPIVIQRATYLKEFADKSKQHLMLYVLSDLDTNKDAKLDENDIKSLYISTIDGTDFRKLSPDFAELIDWNYLPATSTIYFRIVEDSDKNGEFKSKDKIRYFSVNLLEKELDVEEYFPI